MKVKPEFEKEMLMKMVEDIGNAIDLIVSVDLSASLSNYDELSSSQNGRLAHNELMILKDMINKRLK